MPWDDFYSLLTADDYDFWVMYGRSDNIFASGNVTRDVLDAVNDAGYSTNQIIAIAPKPNSYIYMRRNNQNYASFESVRKIYGVKL